MVAVACTYSCAVVCVNSASYSPLKQPLWNHLSLIFGLMTLRLRRLALNWRDQLDLLATRDQTQS